MTVQDAFAKFNQLKIAVIGDVMVDAYIRGKVARMSPEAPVPIVANAKKEDRLGGAANVALNLVALGVQTQLFSVIGKDEAGDILEKLLKDEDIKTGMIKSSDRLTTIKTRIIGNNQHILRVDTEQTNDINETEENLLIAALKKEIDKGLDAIIFEDYNKGVLSERVISEIIALANEKNIITTVDPKKTNFLNFKGVTLFKPNLKELKEGLGRDFSFDEFELFEQAVIDLEAELKNDMTFVTLSEHGVYIKKGIERKLLPAHLRNIADVSGAGDTVIAVATSCLAAGMDPQQMANIANLAGGLVCESSGVVAIDKKMLLEEVLNEENGL
jgi:rfaE bifunctional protein kinase chain/domain|tara:strand:- start:4823 stop:5809 length:987 start_codon:yes stop_codon:yes gene_type:complete